MGVDGAVLRGSPVSYLLSCGRRENPVLTYTPLASGSSGNAALISSGDTHVLLDAGISARRITTALERLREKKMQEYKKDLQKSEERFIDDLVSAARYGRTG